MRIQKMRGNGTKPKPIPIAVRSQRAENRNTAIWLCVCGFSQ